MISRRTLTSFASAAALLTAGAVATSVHAQDIEVQARLRGRKLPSA